MTFRFMVPLINNTTFRYHLIFYWVILQLIGTICENDINK